MKIAGALVGAILSATLLAGCGGGSEAQAQSGDNRLCGRYGLSFSGVLPPNPVQHIAGSGQITSDCQGNLTGVETTDVEGVVCQNTLAGTYVLGADGTGTTAITLTADQPSASCPNTSFTEAIVVTAEGSIVKAINSGPNVITTQEEWVRQGKKS